MAKFRSFIKFLFLFLLCTGTSSISIYASGESKPPIRIGLELEESDYNTSFHIFNENLRHLEKLANIEFVRTDRLNSGTTKEQSIYNVENLLSKNVDGILFTPTSDQVLPAICRMCEDAGVYWGIYWRSITNKDIESLCKACLL